MNHHTNAKSGDGLDAPHAKSGDGLDAPHAQPVKTFNHYATNFIAFIKRIATPDNALIAAFCLIAAQAIVAIVRGLK